MSFVDLFKKLECLECATLQEELDLCLSEHKTALCLGTEYFAKPTEATFSHDSMNSLCQKYDVKNKKAIEAIGDGKLEERFFEERKYLLLSICSILRISDDEGHGNYESCQKFVNANIFNNQQFIESILKGLENLWDCKICYCPEHHFMEQKLLLQVIFLSFYSKVNWNLEIVKLVFAILSRYHLGRNQRILSSSFLSVVDEIFTICNVIWIELLNLESFLMGTRNELAENDKMVSFIEQECKAIEEHSVAFLSSNLFLWNHRLRKEGIDALLDENLLEMCHASSAISEMVKMISSLPFQSHTDLNEIGYKSIAKGFVLLLLRNSEVKAIPNVHLFVKIFTLLYCDCEELAVQFWQFDLSSCSALLDRFEAFFPIDCSFLKVIAAVSSKKTWRQVFNLLDSMRFITTFYDEINSKYLSEEYNFDTNETCYIMKEDYCMGSIVISKGSRGSLIAENLIQWSFSFSVWKQGPLWIKEYTSTLSKRCYETSACLVEIVAKCSESSEFIELMGEEWLTIIKEFFLHLLNLNDDSLYSGCIKNSLQVFANFDDPFLLQDSPLIFSLFNRKPLINALSCMMLSFYQKGFVFTELLVQKINWILSKGFIDNDQFFHLAYYMAIRGVAIDMKALEASMKNPRCMHVFIEELIQCPQESITNIPINLLLNILQFDKREKIIKALIAVIRKSPEIEESQLSNFSPFLKWISECNYSSSMISCICDFLVELEQRHPFMSYMALFEGADKKSKFLSALMKSKKNCSNLIDLVCCVWHKLADSLKQEIITLLPTSTTEEFEQCENGLTLILIKETISTGNTPSYLKSFESYLCKDIRNSPNYGQFLELKLSQGHSIDFEIIKKAIKNNQNLFYYIDRDVKYLDALIESLRFCPSQGALVFLNDLLLKCKDLPEDSVETLMNILCDKSDSYSLFAYHLLLSKQSKHSGSAINLNDLQEFPSLILQLSSTFLRDNALFLAENFGNSPDLIISILTSAVLNDPDNSAIYVSSILSYNWSFIERNCEQVISLLSSFFYLLSKLKCDLLFSCKSNFMDLISKHLITTHQDDQKVIENLIFFMFNHLKPWEVFQNIPSDWNFDSVFIYPSVASVQDNSACFGVLLNICSKLGKLATANALGTLLLSQFLLTLFKPNISLALKSTLVQDFEAEWAVTMKGKNATLDGLKLYMEGVVKSFGTILH